MMFRTNFFMDYNYPEPWDVNIERLTPFITTVLRTAEGKPYAVKYENNITFEEMVFYVKQLLARGYRLITYFVSGDGTISNIWERSCSIYGNSSLARIHILQTGDKQEYYQEEYQFEDDPLGNRTGELLRQYYLLLERRELYRTREKTIRSSRKGTNSERKMDADAMLRGERSVERDRRRIIHTLREELGVDPQALLGADRF